MQATSYPYMVTADEYVGTEETGIDWGALNIMRLANSLRGSLDPFAPVPRHVLLAVEVFAAGLLEKAGLAHE